MSTPVYMVIRTANFNGNLVPPFRVQSWHFQILQEREFFANDNVNWHCVANPFCNGRNAYMAMITAEVARDDETTVRIVSQLRTQVEDAQQDLRALVAADVQRLMSYGGDISLRYVAGDEVNGIQERPWVNSLTVIHFDSQYIRYHVHDVNAHTA